MLTTQQQNPRAASYSLQQQQIDSKEMNSEGDEAHVKNFSIRQYVFACRQKGLLQSWPFSEKCLQMCHSHGLKNVLPPFGLHNEVVSEESSASHNGIILPNLNDPCGDQDYGDNDDKNVRVLKSESLPDHHHHHHHDPIEPMKKQNIMNLGDSGLLKFNNEEISKAMMKTNSTPECVKKNSQVVKCSSGKLLDRRRTRKGRCKKRSLGEILAEARHCSLEEINGMYQFSYAPLGNIIDQGYYCHDEILPLDENNDPRST